MMVEFTANYDLIRGITEEAEQDFVLDQEWSHFWGIFWPQTPCPNALQAEMPV